MPREKWAVCREANVCRGSSAQQVYTRLVCTIWGPEGLPGGGRCPWVASTENPVERMVGRVPWHRDEDPYELKWMAECHKMVQAQPMQCSEERGVRSARVIPHRFQILRVQRPLTIRLQHLLKRGDHTVGTRGVVVLWRDSKWGQLCDGALQQPRFDSRGLRLGSESHVETMSGHRTFLAKLLQAAKTCRREGQRKRR